MPNDAAEPTPEQARVTHVRASTLQGLVRELDALSPEARSALVGSLSPPAQALFQELPGPFQWLDVQAVNELVEAHEAEYGVESVERRVQYTVRQQLSVLHAWMLKLLSPETMFHQATTLYRFNFRGGVVRAEDVRPGRARISIWSHGLYATWYTFALPNWLKGGLGLLGAAEPEVVHLPPAPGGFHHGYEIRWKG